MRVVKVSEAALLEIGEKIPSIKGKVKKVYDQTTGTNNHGDWAIQNLVLVDLENPKVEVKVKVFDQSALPKSYEGKLLYIQSADDNGKIKGVEVAQDKYKWKEGEAIKKLIEVKKAANVTLADMAAPAQPQEQPKPTTPPPADSRTTNAPPASTAPASAPAGTAAPAAAPQKTKEQIRAEADADELAKRKGHVAEFRRMVARSLNAFELIMQGVDHLAKRRADTGKAMTPEQIHGTTTTIYIQTQRGGLVDTLPYDAIEKYLPEKKSGTDAGK